MKWQSLVAKCCKIRKIWTCQVWDFFCFFVTNFCIVFFSDTADTVQPTLDTLQPSLEAMTPVLDELIEQLEASMKGSGEQLR